MEVLEEQGRIAADIAFCGPAFLAAVCRHMALEASRFRPDLPAETAPVLVAETLMGTAQLLTKGGMSQDGLIRRGSVPGGVAAEALKGMDRALPGLWAEVYATTDRVEEAKKRKLFPDAAERG